MYSSRKLRTISPPIHAGADAPRGGNRRSAAPKGCVGFWVSSLLTLTTTARVRAGRLNLPSSA